MRGECASAPCEPNLRELDVASAPGRLSAVDSASGGERTQGAEPVGSDRRAASAAAIWLSCELKHKTVVPTQQTGDLAAVERRDDLGTRDGTSETRRTCRRSGVALGAHARGTAVILGLDRHPSVMNSRTGRTRNALRAHWWTSPRPRTGPVSSLPRVVPGLTEPNFARPQQGPPDQWWNILIVSKSFPLTREEPYSEGRSSA